VSGSGGSSFADWDVLLCWDSSRLARDSVVFASARPIEGAFDGVAAKLAGAIDAGWLVSLRLLDARVASIAESHHLVTGFVVRRDRADAEAAAERLRRMLD